MNYVKQAYELSSENRALALEIYEYSVVELVNINYVPQTDNVHTELSAIFGERWIGRKYNYERFLPAQMAEANIAFNYANLTLGSMGKFKKTANRLLSKHSRVSDRQLEQMGLKMNCLLTNTTPQQFL